MNITSYTSLYTSISDECHKIADICKKHDNCAHSFFIDDDVHDSSLPILYCAWENNKILGFISAYIIDLETVEICAFVLPEYRRRQIATSIFDCLLEDYEDHYIQTCVNKDNEIGRLFLNNLECEHHSTECKMILNKSIFSELAITKNSLTIRESLFENYTSENSVSYDAYLSDIQIGTCMVLFSGNTAVIHDVEIFDTYRRKGYAYELLSEVIINVLKTCDSVILHVTKENVPAYRLYLKLGFSIVEELEYYSI